MIREGEGKVGAPVPAGKGMRMEAKFLPYESLRFSPQESHTRGREFLELFRRRRSVRKFSSRAVPREWIELALKSAASAPSGANRQPWTFVAVGDPELKRRIREAAEDEEKISYQSRMPDEWLKALEPLGTEWKKSYLEIAPWLVVVFAQSYGLQPDGIKIKHYYVQESVGIACGLFIAAIHNMGLVTLTHTPSPMGFLSSILGRPENERPYMLFPVGYPADDARVPEIEKKSIQEVSEWREGPEV